MGNCLLGSAQATIQHFTLDFYLSCIISPYTLPEKLNWKIDFSPQPHEKSNPLQWIYNNTRWVHPVFSFFQEQYLPRTAHKAIPCLSEMYWVTKTHLTRLQSCLLQPEAFAKCIETFPSCGGGVGAVLQLLQQLSEQRCGLKTVHVLPSSAKVL